MKHLPNLTFVLCVLMGFACSDINKESSQNRLHSTNTQIVNKKPFWKRNRKTGPLHFAKYHHSIRTRTGDKTSRYRTQYKNFERNKSLKQLSPLRSRDILDWQERGPGNVGGRTRGIWVDPTDSTSLTWLVGSAGGGVWKTEDGGNSWRIVSEELSNMATSTLAGGVSNPNVIYAGTGEGFDGFMITGNGIWKSIDGGENWEVLTSTADNPDFANITRIIVDPEDENTLIVSTRANFLLDEDSAALAPVSYILKSTDGGVSWKATYNSDPPDENFDPNIGVVQQLVPNPKDFNELYACVNASGILKSTDKGDSWQWVFDAKTEEIGRIEMAVSPTHPNVLYFAAESGESNGYLSVSNDRGTSWQRVAGEQFNWLGGQGWYDNTIAVHPYDTNTVFVGGVGPILAITRSGSQINVEQFSGLENATDFLHMDDYFPGGDGGALSTEDFVKEFLFFVIDPSEVEFSPSLADVEIRFGSGKSQMAHFHEDLTTPSYQSYGEVPFEVWDVTNNQQLMVSVHDESQDGEWDIEIEDFFTVGVEALSIHNIPYDSMPSPLISERLLLDYSYYMVLAGDTANQELDLMDLPEGKLTITKETLQADSSNFIPVVDGYSEYGEDFFTKGVHVDHHNLVLIPENNQAGNFYIINANDGGIAFSKDGGETFLQTGDTFKEQITFNGDTLTYPTANGYNTSQFYGIDKMNGADRYIGGTQDNGSFVSPVDADSSSEWAIAPSGDGFEAAWHYGNPDLLLESSQFNNIFKSTDGGQSWEPLTLPGFGPFLTRIANSKQDPDLVFAVSSEGILRSVDFGDTWEVIPTPSEWQFNNNPIEVSVASPQVVWSAGSLTEEERIVVSNDGGSSFVPTAGYPEAKLGAVTGIATHPTNPIEAFALFSMADGPKILKTTNLGKSWEDISGFETNKAESANGFPDVAVYSLVVMPFDTSQIWVGTEIGLFESLDGGNSWQYADNGLPPLAIFEMKIVNDEVIVASHGRGIWSVSLPELQGYEPPAAILGPRISANGTAFNGNVRGEYTLRNAYDSTSISVSIPLSDSDTLVQSLDIQGNENTLEEEFRLVFDLQEDSVYLAKVEITSYFEGSSLKSSTTVTVFDVDEEPVSSYNNDFDQGLSDFARLGFSSRLEFDFANKALHSLHPYPGDNAEFFAVFQKPILVGEGSTLSFDEIVLVEPGFADDWQDPDFFDYVAIEATRDEGKSWEVLDAYDSRLHPEWEDAYLNAPFFGDTSLFKPHILSLNTYFEVGDTVFLRFKLVSDPFEEGWGWAIDNLTLSSSVTTSRKQNLDAFLNLRVYPNPISTSAKIQYTLNEPAQVSVTLHALDGRRVKTLVFETQPAGEKVIPIELNDLSGGTYLLRLGAGNNLQTVSILKQ
ncbi:MAG: T9SS type A sorting domain-containing protein [Bacteroidota bacterium]